MQPDDSVLDAALAAGERVHTQVTRLGGKDFTKQIRSWKVERAYNTDLPEAMRAFSGSSSAQLELELGGAGGASAPQLYSPWAKRSNGDVVRPGQSVTLASGANDRNLPAFRGTVRSRSAASGTDTVKLTALDNAERLRGPAVLPKPYGGLLRKRPIATATWCIDELLRQAGIDSCPPPRAPDYDASQPFTVVYASLHGGVAPTYGTPEVIPDPKTYGWTRAGAPHEMALLPAQPGLTVGWFPRNRTAVLDSTLLGDLWVDNRSGQGSKVELKFYLDRTDTAQGWVSLAVDFSTGKIALWSGTVDGAGYGQVWTWSELTTQKGAFHIGGFFDFTDTSAVFPRWFPNWEVDGGVVPTGYIGPTSRFPKVFPMVTAPNGLSFTGGPTAISTTGAEQFRSELNRVDLITDMAAECVQVTAGYSSGAAAAAFAQTWSKAAVLDDPVLPLYTIPSVSGTRWDAITEISQSSLSTSEFDESGVFRWRNHNRFVNSPAQADLTMTAVREIAAITIAEEIDACRNYCVQPYKDYSKVTAVQGTVYDDTAIRSIAPGASIELAYSLAEDEYDVGPPLTDDDVTDTGGFAVRFATAPVANAPAVKGLVDTQVRREGGSLYLRLTNRARVTLYTVTKDGKPSVHLWSFKASAEPAERKVTAQSTTSQAKYGLQQYFANATDWVQDYGAAAALAGVLNSAGRYPIPVLSDVDVLYDPRVQLGDVIRLVDNSGVALDVLAWVIGISTTGAADGSVRQTLTLRGTQYNGLPVDTGLSPDPPVDVSVWATRSYAQATAGYPTLDSLTASGLRVRDLLRAPIQ